MQRKSGFRVYTILSGLNRMKWITAGKSILCGLAAGLLVVLFRLGMGFGADKAIRIYAFLRQHPAAVAPWLLLICAVGWLLARLIQYEPMASGSGIPQVEGMVIHGLKMRDWPVLAVRFLAGILSSFFGLSLGREGPSIQIGAAGSQAIAKKTGRNKLEENTLVTAGAAAGLATAFNAPLSGIVFALEEVHRSFSPLILITATTASLTADVVAALVFGLKPILSFTQTPELLVTLYLWLLPLGILSGIIGSVTNRALLYCQTAYNRVPAKLRPAAALLLALPFGLFLPQVLGGGAGLINSAEIAHSGILFLLLLLAGKLLFTCTSFGSGVPGGIFLPILSIGALLGSAVGLAAVRFGMPYAYVPDFAVCGMAGALSSAVKAPVTSILLTVEMTGSLVHLFPVAACAFIALLVSDLLKTKPIYEALLERMMADGGEQKPARSHKHGGIVEIPVEYGSRIAGKRLSEIELPEGVLIAGIHRGESDIVPNGKAVVMPGDYLTVLSSEHSFGTVNSKMRNFCHNKL